MTDIGEAIQGAINTARDVAGVQVQYLQRGDSSEPFALTAIIGSSKFERHTADGVVVMSPVRDFLVDASALVEDPDTDEPELIDPEPGDRIAHVERGVRYIYEVMPLGGSGEAEHLDATTNQWRIHTRLTKRIPAGDPWP
jgi:hypothetical protein